MTDNSVNQNNPEVAQILNGERLNKINFPDQEAEVDAVLITPYHLIMSDPVKYKDYLNLLVEGEYHFGIKTMLKLLKKFPDLQFTGHSKSLLNDHFEKKKRLAHEYEIYYGGVSLLEKPDDFFKKEDIETVIESGNKELFERLLRIFGPLSEKKSITSYLRDKYGYDISKIEMRLRYGYDPNSIIGNLKGSDTILNWTVQYHRDPQLALLLLKYGAKSESRLYGILYNEELNSILDGHIKPVKYPEYNSPEVQQYEGDDYEIKKVPELRNLLRRRGLKISGRKQELINRLREYDFHVD